MRASAALRTLGVGLSVVVATVVSSKTAQAEAGKWVATITQLTGGGAADVSVEPRNDRQSRARITFRNSKSNVQLAWDIVVGSCRDEGVPIAPQAAFTAAQTQMDGGGSATANVPKLESGKKYYVRVYDPKKAPTDASAFGCANLSEQT